ncbi:MAG: peptidoglycan editing factor PgeF [Oscillospiraceae bacterium]
MRSALLRCAHGFSTRLGGVSGGIFESLNLGRLDTLGDDPEKVAENWRRFGAAVGIDTARFVHGRQVHGNHVHIAAPEDAHGIRENSALEADGYVTNIPGLPLAVFTADCAPLLMEDTDAGVIAAVHCGWRPTAADIMGEAVRAMCSLGAQPQNIRAAIGPCIRRCCFQTGPEVPRAMEALLGDAGGLYADDPAAPGKFRVDLPGVVARRLTQLGIPAEQIDDLGACTMCAPDTFWSHRRLGLQRGSQANMIML